MMGKLFRARQMLSSNFSDIAAKLCCAKEFFKLEGQGITFACDVACISNRYMCLKIFLTLTVSGFGANGKRTPVALPTYKDLEVQYNV